MEKFKDFLAGLAFGLFTAAIGALIIYGIHLIDKAIR